MPPIISVENVGKRYRLHHEGRERYTALRDVITRKAGGLLQKLKFGKQKTETQNAEGQNPFQLSQFPISALPGGSTDEDFWALKDVSFEVKQGEVVGIIGRNGAGKSTLLKILSRITEPTTGRITLRGRVASLLEVGTGFHPELTGRENIFLNGAILGMSKVEIRSKFDEIVAFAEIEKFLDTPVKRYSSGMYVRLAFAVAAHLEPEILVVDEVLAVGDTQFQKRCLGRMQAVANSGRTVLFVSHNMNAVESLCTHALLLDRGHICEQSHDVRSVITKYLSGTTGGSGESAWVNPGDAFKHRTMRPISFAVVNQDDQPLTAPVRNDTPLQVVIRAEIYQLDPALNLGFSLFDQDSHELLWSLTTDGPEVAWPKLETGEVELRCALPRRFLNEGTYRLELFCSLHCRDWFIRPSHNSPAVHFEIQGGLSDSPYWTFARSGILAPEWQWRRTK